MIFSHNSSKEPTIKRKFGKLKSVPPRSNQIVQNALPFKEKKFGQFDVTRKLNQVREKNYSSVHTDPTRQLKSISKNWWIHLWSGLVLDQEAKHRIAMRQAVWLYLFLLLAANRRTGVLYRRVSTIVAETGFNRRSIQRWLKLLREGDYIITKSTGRALHISITKWRPIARKKIINNKTFSPATSPSNEHEIQQQ